MKNYVLFIISLVFMTHLSAQDSDYNPYQKSRYLGVEGIFNCTLMDLDANNYRDGGGFSFSGFKDITSSRNPLVLQWGAEGLFAVSSKAREFYIDDAFGTYRISSPTNMTLGLNGLLRLEYRKYAVHPYIDGFVGGRLFSSGYTDDNGFDNEDDYQAMKTTGRFAYGVGAGVFVPVTDRLDLNFRTAYTHTPEMDYINMNDFIDNTRNTLSPLAASEYDMLSFHVGIRYRFEQKSKEERRREKQERRKSDCCDDYRSCCDKSSRQRRRPLRDVLINVGWGGPVICTPPPTDCPADSYPNPPRTDDNESSTTECPTNRPNPFFDDDEEDEDDNPRSNDNDPYTPVNDDDAGSSTNACPPTYDSNASSDNKPDRSTNTNNNPQTYDNKPLRPRPDKGTRNSSSGGSTRSGSTPNRIIKGSKGG